ncbi:MAG: lyase [Gemmatimonadales bacterium]|nr:MAG: lyase [Gemmatimonadales bacterium]
MQAGLEFQEWDVPWEQTRPRDPYRAPDGTIFFVGQQGDYVGHLDPASGEMRRFELPEGAGPHNVIVDLDGYAWYAGNRDAHIGRLDPETGEILRFDMPEGVDDPHTLVWNSTGDMWFTAQRSGDAGFIGRFSPESGEVRAVAVPGSQMRPYGIVVDSADRPWIAFMGSNAIGTVDPETMELEIIETPDEDSRIRRIGVTSDDRIWFVDAARGWLGMYDPSSGEQEQWLSPGGEATGLYAMAVDDLDRIWYVESRMDPNRFVGFDPATEEFFAVDEVPSGGGAVRHMVFWPEDGAIWFGTDTHTIGRALVPR